MSIFEQDQTIVIDGLATDVGLQSADPLVRAVIISLFTWRRANADDVLPGTDRMGWWGDGYATVLGDRIGSRLWLLSRAKLTAQTISDAEDYAREALQWLIDDGVATAVDVLAERMGLTGLALACTITRTDGVVTDLRFDNVWESFRAL